MIRAGEHGLGRLAIASVLLALAVGCADENRNDPCNSGCGWGGGSPHPYTSYSGGDTASISGAASVSYGGDLVTFSCSASDTCEWSGSMITIEGALPQTWRTEDAGPDADVDADIDAAAEGPTGSPRGWGASGRVVVIDLGSTSLTESGPLVGARIVSCDDRYEALRPDDAGTYRCESATSRPARVDEPLVGRLVVSVAVQGESTTKTLSVDGNTVTGSVRITSTATHAPSHAHLEQDCY